MRYILLLGILFTCQVLYSQRAFRARLMAGAVTSQISGDGLGGWDKFGLMGGGEVAVPLSEKWSFSGGIRYTQKGSRTKRDTINFNTFAYKLEYIDLPLKLLYSQTRNGEDFLTFGAGVSAGYLMRQRQMNNGAYYDINPPFSSF
ncbi:MAG: outer membrane beta-barrel protein, partial [Flavobacteriales bacterium]